MNKQAIIIGASGTIARAITKSLLEKSECRSYPVNQ